MAFIAALFVISIYVLEVWSLLRWLINKLSKRPSIASTQDRLARISKYALHILALAGIVCLLYGYFVEPYWIEIKTVEIKTPILQKAHLRLVQISDLHCDRKIRNETTLPGLVNSLQPDIVAFTGDTINTPEALPTFQQTMAAIRAPLGKFAVRGNWDDWYWSKLDLFTGTGFEVLDKGYKEITIGDEKIYLAGVSCNNADFWRAAINKIPPETFCVFLYHYPDLIEDVAYSGIDLYLAGHTHGGQVALPFYGALLTFSRFGKKYEAGHYSVGETILYVNRGIGMEGGNVPRIRFGARPEITVFDIRPQ